MAHHFEYNLNDYVEFTFKGITLTGTIYATDIERCDNIGFYLIGYDPSYYDYLNDCTETLVCAMSNLFEEGDSNIADNIPKDGLFLWVLEDYVLNVLMKNENPKVKSIKMTKKESFGRWLSGIDQYSADNYRRGNSGFNWL